MNIIVIIFVKSVSLYIQLHTIHQKPCSSWESYEAHALTLAGRVSCVKLEYLQVWDVNSITSTEAAVSFDSGRLFRQSKKNSAIVD